jgi:hypothetical protein
MTPSWRRRAGELPGEGSGSTLAERQEVGTAEAADVEAGTLQGGK